MQIRDKDSFRIYKLVHTIKSDWKIILVFVVAFTSLAVYWAVNGRNVYQADILLAPHSENSDPLASMLGRLGGIAGLAGVSIGDSKPEVSNAIATLKSRELLVPFIKGKDLKKKIYPALWDIETGTWKGPGVLSSFLIRIQGRDPNAPRNGYMLHEPGDLAAVDLFLRKHMTISVDDETSIVRLVISAYSAQDAAEWANDLIASLNSYIRLKEQEQAARAMTFLREELQRTSVASVQQSLADLIEGQAKKLMLASVREQFVFKVLDPAVPPEVKSKPNRLLRVTGGAFAGGIFGCLFVLWRRKAI